MKTTNNKLIMLQSFRGIPKGAIVINRGYCIDCGYSCYLVEYKGLEYKPYENDCISEEELKRKLNYHRTQLKIYNKINRQFKKHNNKTL